MNRITKNTLCAFVLALAFLTACGKTSNTDAPTPDVTSTAAPTNTSAAPTAAPTNTPTTAPTDTPTSTPTQTPLPTSASGLSRGVKTATAFENPYVGIKLPISEDYVFLSDQEMLSRFGQVAEMFENVGYFTPEQMELAFSGVIYDTFFLLEDGVSNVVINYENLAITSADRDISAETYLKAATQQFEHLFSDTRHSYFTTYEIEGSSYVSTVIYNDVAGTQQLYLVKIVEDYAVSIILTFPSLDTQSAQAFVDKIEASAPLELSPNNTAFVRGGWTIEKDYIENLFFRVPIPKGFLFNAEGNRNFIYTRNNDEEVLSFYIGRGDLGASQNEVYEYYMTVAQEAYPGLKFTGKNIGPYIGKVGFTVVQDYPVEVVIVVGTDYLFYVEAVSEKGLDFAEEFIAGIQFKE